MKIIDDSHLLVENEEEEALLRGVSNLIEVGSIPYTYPIVMPVAADSRRWKTAQYLLQGIDPWGPTGREP